MKGKVKIEVAKNNGNWFYTGILKDYDKDHYQIDTIKNERLIFRKDQIVQIEMIGDDKDERS